MTMMPGGKLEVAPKDNLLSWFFTYEGKQYAGGFDIRKVLEWFSEPDREQMGFRVYLDGGKTHWLTTDQMKELMAKMARTI